MIGGIPLSLQGFSCYLDAIRELGVVDLELPNIEFQTDTLTGSGIAGEIEMPIPGLTKAMSIKIKKRAVNAAFTNILAPITHNLTFRGNVAMADPSHPLQSVATRKVRVVANVKPKSMNLGKAEVAKAMDTELEYEVISIQVLVDEVPALHIDKFNNKFEVDGVNYLDEDSFL